MKVEWHGSVPLLCKHGTLFSQLCNYLLTSTFYFLNHGCLLYYDINITSHRFINYPAKEISCHYKVQGGESI